MIMAVVFDLEIKKCIPDRGSVHSGAIEYCAGWSDFAGMGISVACAYDTDQGRMYTFVDDNPLRPEYEGLQIDGGLSELSHLMAQADYIIGFNNHSFDNQLLKANMLNVPSAKSYDIYVEVIDAAGLSTAPFAHRKGYRLDDVSRANGIQGKTGAGVMAPVLYQTGRMRELHEYCQHDVEMTVQVLALINDHKLICPRSQRVLPVRTPQEKLGMTQRGLLG
jgi:hypothetical protein